jgi:hypothetical protein
MSVIYGMRTFEEVLYMGFLFVYFVVTARRKKIVYSLHLYVKRILPHKPQFAARPRNICVLS